MSYQNILNKIDRLGDLFADMYSDPELFDICEAKKEETEQLIADIIDYLMWVPGALFYHENQSKQRRNQVVIDLLWKTIDSEEIFDELLSGGYSGLLVNMLGDFSERVKMLKPTFITVNPDNTEFALYYAEAMRAWLFGLTNAALIICFAIIEDLLKDRLCQVNIDYVYDLKDPANPKGVKQVSYDRIIMASLNEGMINKKDKNILFKIKKLRNDSIHKLASVSDSEVYEAINQTKRIVEKLLNK